MTITKSELRRQIRILTDWGVPISYVEPKKDAYLPTKIENVAAFLPKKGDK